LCFYLKIIEWSKLSWIYIFIHIRDTFNFLFFLVYYLSFILPIFFHFLTFPIFVFVDGGERGSSFVSLKYIPFSYDEGSMKGRGIEDQVRIHGRNSTCRTHLCVCDYSRVGALSPAWHHQVAAGNVRERTHDSPLRSQPHTIQRNQSFPILLMT